MQLKSGRLLYREFTEDDFPLFYSVFGSKQVMRYAYNDCFTSEESARNNFENVLKEKTAENRRDYEFAVFTAENNEFIGYADIDVKSRNSYGGCSEIGYFLLPAFWGSGYASEIADTLIEYCFSKMNLHRVCASCNANNLASEKVMRKAGMIKEGMLRKVRFKHGAWDDECRYSILVEEWEKKRTR